jgi:antitoxin (DNA-binding transcriptional repressor) of toxin-antitoxin stability system
MKTFTLHDLQTRTADLIDHAKGGESSWITYQGKPLVMAVSCGFDLADTRMATALATGLYLQEEISLGRAAQLAHMSRSQFVEHLASLDTLSLGSVPLSWPGTSPCLIAQAHE